MLDLDVRRKKNSFSMLLWILLTSIIIFQQMPIIKDSFYSELRIIIYILFILLSFYSIFSIQHYLRIPFLKHFLFTVIFTSLINCALFVFSDVEVNFMELLIPFGIFIISLNSALSYKNLRILIYFFVISTMLMAIINILYYTGGFNISEQYLVPLKNQIGPIIGISAVITVWLIIKKTDKGISYIFFNLLLFALLVTSLIVIRNRASIVAIFIIIVTMFMFKNKFKINISYKRIIYLCLIIVLIIILSLFGVTGTVFSDIWKSMTLNYDINNLNSLSAGRMDVYKAAIRYIFANPVLGEAGSILSFPNIPHNYILYQWVNKGIIASIPLILFYVYLWIFTLRGLFSRGMPSLIYWILLFSLFISIFEYTYPYGPGVSQFFLWFLLGQYLKEKYNVSQI